MWTCPKCGRSFKRAKQPHSCQTVPLAKHFLNKEKAKEIYNFLTKEIKEKIGDFQIISLPCCIHFFGCYDFLAALPKKDGIEIRFALNRQLKSPGFLTGVWLSGKKYKNCLKIGSRREVTKELIDWLRESYRLEG